MLSNDGPRNKMMQLIPLFALLLTLDVSVMLIFKYVELSLHLEPTYFFKVATSPLVWTGLTIAAMQLWVWTRILKRTELSLAYPICSMAYPITMLMATLLFHERLSLQVWIGALFIVGGVILIGATSQNPESQDADSPAEITPIRQFHELP